MKYFLNIALYKSLESVSYLIETDTFIQQRRIKLTKSDGKYLKISKT